MGQAIGSAGAATAGAAVHVLALGSSPWTILLAGLPVAITASVEGVRYAAATRSMNRLVAKAGEELRTDEDGLADAIRNAGTDAMPLMLDVFEAASRTTNDQKIDALARVWAHGLSDDTQVSEDLLMIKTLLGLDEVHVEVMHNLPAHDEKTAEDESQLKFVSETEVFEICTGLGHMVPAILAGLRSLGVVRTAGTWDGGGFVYQLNAWGGLTLDYLAEHSGDAGDTSELNGH